MGDTGAKEGLLLRETTTLEKLDIGSNHITPLGASFVFAGLAENVGVDRFIFDSNSIGVEGCDALGKCLERNQYIGGILLHAWSALVNRSAKVYLQIKVYGQFRFRRMNEWATKES